MKKSICRSGCEYYMYDTESHSQRKCWVCGGQLEEVADPPFVPTAEIIDALNNIGHINETRRYDSLVASLLKPEFIETIVSRLSNNHDQIVTLRREVEILALFVHFCQNEQQGQDYYNFPRCLEITRRYVSPESPRNKRGKQ